MIDPQNEPKHHVSSLLILIFALAILMIVGIAFFIIRTQTPKQAPQSIKNQPTIGIKHNVSRDLVLPPDPPAEEYITSYVGRIIAIDLAAKTLVIDSAQGEKRVTFNNATVLASVTVPQNATSEQRTRALQSEIPISNTTELAVGSTIFVESSTNIKNADTFTASKIVLIK